MGAHAAGVGAGAAVFDAHMGDTEMDASAGAVLVAEPERRASAEAAGPPLTETHYAEVRQAVRARRRVKGAARTALFSGAVTLAIGVLAAPFVLVWPSASGVMIVVGVCAVGAVELVGYRRVRRAEPSAARLLGLNQLALLGVVALYCMMQMAAFSPEEAQAAAMSPEVRAQLNAVPEMARSIDNLVLRWAPIVTYGFYSLVIGLSVCSQGAMALYYFTRRKHIERFNRATPQWIRRLFVEMGA